MKYAWIKQHGGSLGAIDVPVLQVSQSAYYGWLHRVPLSVVFGKSAAFAATLDLSSIDGSSGFRLDGGAPRDGLGSSVSSAGDVNGDGFSDVIVGVSRADPNGHNSGSSYVIFGKSTGFGATLDLASLDGSNGFRLDGEATHNFSGFFSQQCG